MPLTAREQSGKTFDPMPEGVHMAVCCAVYDVGTHYSERFDKRSHECVITWETPEERLEIEKDGAKMSIARTISKKYTLSLGEKANLRKDLQSWRGRVFTEEELFGFDMKNVVSKSCMIQVIHNKKDDKVYANISAIMPLYKGMPQLTPENPIRYYSIEDHAGEIPEGTPGWIEELIKSSDEWNAWLTENVPDELPPITDDEPPF